MGATSWQQPLASAPAAQALRYGDGAYNGNGRHANRKAPIGLSSGYVVIEEQGVRDGRRTSPLGADEAAEDDGERERKCPAGHVRHGLGVVGSGRAAGSLHAFRRSPPPPFRAPALLGVQALRGAAYRRSAIERISVLPC